MTTVATRNDDQPTVGQFITRLQPEIARALPRGMDADRIARLALTVVRQDRALQRCKPESFGGALLTAAALGLEVGVNGEAYLVAYKNECTLIVGYQGLAKLFWNHPLAAHLDAQAVHENDDFDYWYGINPDLVHKPARGDRGPVTHYWAAARLSSGASAFVVLTVDEVKALRGGKSGSNGGISDPMHWMGRKTAVRQLFKLLPKTTNMSAAMAVDQQTGSTLADRGVPQGIADGTVPSLPPAVAERTPGEDANRVTAAEITVNPDTGQVTDPNEQCAVCGGHGGQHDDELHEVAGA